MANKKLDSAQNNKSMPKRMLVSQLQKKKKLIDKK